MSDFVGDYFYNQWRASMFCATSTPLLWAKITSEEDNKKEKTDMPTFPAAPANLSFKFRLHCIPEIKNVVYNGTTTIIVWVDGSKTVCKLGEGETFDRYTGFMACVCKKLFGGTTTAKKLMNEKDADFQAALNKAKEDEAKAKAAQEAEERAAAVARHKAKAREKEIQAMAERFLMEDEALRIVEKVLNDRAIAERNAADGAVSKSENHEDIKEEK